MGSLYAWFLNYFELLHCTCWTVWPWLMYRLMLLLLLSSTLRNWKETFTSFSTLTFVGFYFQRPCPFTCNVFWFFQKKHICNIKLSVYNSILALTVTSLNPVPSVSLLTCLFGDIDFFILLLVFRGKCCVTLLNETEALKSYLDREVCGVLFHSRWQIRDRN